MCPVAAEANGSSATGRHGPSIAQIYARRREAGKLVALTAAYSDSEMFKTQRAKTKKPLAKRWESHLTLESLTRAPCTLKVAARFLKNPGLISLGGGLPCPEYFPFDSLSATVTRFPSDQIGDVPINQTFVMGKYDISERQGVHDLSVALNYGQATGSAQMIRWVTEHTELVHNPPYADWRTCLSIGCTGALELALRMLCDGHRQDSWLLDNFTFSTAIETSAPLGIKPVGVEMDEEGLLSDDLDEILTTWNAADRGARKPHVLYTVPCGQNPTGSTQGLDRKRAIYAVCQKHDVYIIEDDPYYYIQMESCQGEDKQTRKPVKSVDAFLTSLIPSYLSLDVDGRVMRIDSFSKVVAPGLRLGWVTASEQMIDRFTLHAETANQGPAGLSQGLMYKLLDEEWGHQGFLKWLMHLQLEYTARRNNLVSAFERHLPKEIVSWNHPTSGMFCWLHLNHRLHPKVQSLPLKDIEEEIFETLIAMGVLVARGSWFQADPDRPLPGLFFRATFAAASLENMEEATKRLGQAIRDSFSTKP